MTASNALSVERLRVELTSGLPVVDDLDLEVAPGEILGLVGESGSGKTTTALALLGYSRPGVRIRSGTVKVSGTAIDLHDERATRGLRGSIVAYVPQDPANALNPSLRVKAAIQDVLDAHGARARPELTTTAALASVHLPTSGEFVRRFPHELSGGQQQRVAISMALACEPPLVVLDEPTTGLDVITQARVLDELRRLRDELSLAMVYVSHDLAVVAQIADRVAVMYAGTIVEEGPAEEVLRRPRHPYTRGLVDSIPDHANPRRLVGMPGIAGGVEARLPGCSFAPRCPQRLERCETEKPPPEHAGNGIAVRCFAWSQTPGPRVVERSAVAPADAAQATVVVDGLRAEHRSRGHVVVAADAVSFTLETGRCAALVGESGSGKTTVARCLAGLHVPSSGSMLLDGQPLAGRARHRTLDQRRRIQIIFQNPLDSLNPRHRVSDTLARPARLLRGLSRREAEAEVGELLERVRLPKAVATRYPGELSGGERQRIAIARALGPRPDVIVCDEVTSALDVSVQAAVLELLSDLRTELGLALLFISHDLGVVASIADTVLVLERGIVREQGPVAQVLSAPSHPYTRALLEAAPSVSR